MTAALAITLPQWVEALVDSRDVFPTDEDRMRLAIALARENVRHGTGGPFGAAVFEQASGRLVAAGVNGVERLHNSALHAEVMALMLAEARLRSYTLNAPHLPAHELVTSCEPCAMCLGAALWSGVKRIVCGAVRDDAMEVGFEEGPVFPESYQYLETRGIEVVRGVLADEAAEVLKLYRWQNGLVYNG